MNLLQTRLKESLLGVITLASIAGGLNIFLYEWWSSRLVQPALLWGVAFAIITFVLLLPWFLAVYWVVKLWRRGRILLARSVGCCTSVFFLGFILYQLHADYANAATNVTPPVTDQLENCIAFLPFALCWLGLGLASLLSRVPKEYTPHP